MNYKRLALVALSSILLPSQTWSLQDIPESQYRRVLGSNTFGSNEILSGPNCKMSTHLTCTIDDLDNSSCGDFFIKRSECLNHGDNGVINVTMNLKYCNNEGERVIKAIENRTEILVYNEPVQNLDNSPLSPEFCRERELKIQVDTCNRGKIVGSLKVEALADTLPGDAEDLDLYCYGWYFYKTQIIMPEGTIRPPVPGTKPPTPLPTSPPTPSPTPFPNLSYTLKIKCFIKDDTTGDFDIPCEDVDFTKFSAGELNRDILLRYTIDNKSNEPLDVSSLITSIADESEATLISPAADMIVPKQSEKDIVDQFYILNFANYANDNVVIGATVVVSGMQSNTDSEGAAEHFVSIPDLFQLSMDTNVQCFIDDGSGRMCAEYMSTMDPGACDANVKFQYKVQNIGTACEQVDNVNGVIDISSSPTTLAQSNLEFPNGKVLCPGDELDIFQHVTPMNLCNLSEEVRFGIQINGGGKNREGQGFMVSPMGSDVEVGAPDPAPAPGDFSINLNMLKCHTFDENQNQIDCQDFIHSNANCIQEIVYKFKIKHTGDVCRMIQGNIVVNIGDEEFFINVDDWKDKRRNFCPNESISIEHPTVINVCEELAGKKIEINAALIGEEASKSMEFPASDPVADPVSAPVSAPMSAPVSAPMSAPVSAPTRQEITTCNSHPDYLTFQFAESNCQASTNNHWRRKLRGNRSLRKVRKPSSCKTGGKGKGGTDCSPPTPVPPAPTPVAVDDTGGVNIPGPCQDFGDFNNGPFNIEIKSLTGPVRKLLDSTVADGDSFSIGSPSNLVPDIVSVEIWDSGGQLVQTSTIHTSCSIHSMFKGEKFGALRLVGFENDHGVAF